MAATYIAVTGNLVFATWVLWFDRVTDVDGVNYLGVRLGTRSATAECKVVTQGLKGVTVTAVAFDHDGNVVESK